MRTRPSSSLMRSLKMLGDGNRLAILMFLKDGPRCACEIHPAIGISQNLASHHLKTLKAHGLVTSRREGTKIIYARSEARIDAWQTLFITTLG